jgi:predicted ATP-dependent endonuclease of OLD family
VEGYLLKQFPEGTKVIFSVDDPQLEDLLKRFKTEVDDGIKTDANQKGDGMQRAIMLAIIQAYADFRKQHGDGKTFLFLIDEAELHLHPSAQRALKKALLDIVGQGDQVIINTHSSVLVVDDAEGQKVLKVEKENGQTHVTSADKTDLQGIIYELLGGSPSDLLFPKNFIIVEGKSDFEFIKNVIKRFYESEYGDIQILFAGGDIDAQEESMLSVHRLFVPIATSRNPIYKEKVVIVCDKPNATQETKYRQFRDGYPYIQDNEQLFVIPENSIEQYYPGEWKKTEEEVRQMQTEQTKVSYAKQVASAILKETFESEMSIIFNALKKAKERSF